MLHDELVAGEVADREFEHQHSAPYSVPEYS